MVTTAGAGGSADLDVAVDVGVAGVVVGRAPRRFLIGTACGPLVVLSDTGGVVVFGVFVTQLTAGASVVAATIGVITAAVGVVIAKDTVVVGTVVFGTVGVSGGDVVPIPSNHEASLSSQLIWRTVGSCWVGARGPRTFQISCGLPCGLNVT